MLNLIKAEMFKILHSFGFKLLCLWNISTIYDVFRAFAEGRARKGYTALAVFAGYTQHHMEVGSLLAAMFLCNEFSNGTIGTGLLCGYSRKQVFRSKLLGLLLGKLSLFFIYISIPTIICSVVNGFGDAPYSDVITLSCCAVLGYVTMGAFIFFVSVLVQNPILTVGICAFLNQSILIQGIEIYEGRWSNPLLKYTFIYQLDQLNVRYCLKSGKVNNIQGMQRLDEFSLNLFLPVMLITLVITLAASAVIFEKRNLK